LLAQQGVNLIERVVLGMRSAWRPTGVFDVGIDGTIELCDRATGEALNLLVQLQSKATAVPWANETDQGFDYHCRPQDVDYWLQGNAPVILVCSRPRTGEAYWISVKNHFHDPERRRTGRASFDKQRDRFVPDAYQAIRDLAEPADAGLYLAATPKPEQLVSNLLAIRSFADRVYVADTDLRTRGEVYAVFRDQLGVPCPSEWILHDKRMISFHDLAEYPWDEVCDRGTVEGFHSREWADATDQDRRRQFVQLLNGALREKLFPQVRFRGDLECYTFAATPEKRARRVRYASSRGPGRTVFQSYTSKGKDGRTFTHYRHYAFQGQFLRYDDQWFLEITPTYVYTWDGWRLDRFHSDRLSGIKRLERNPAVHHQLLLWVDYLKRGGDLFDLAYPFLAFGDLRAFELGVGIEDAAWQARDEELVDPAAAGQRDLDEFMVQATAAE
jgi:hypothetical protein